jgi:hypothetical protein
MKLKEHIRAIASDLYLGVNNLLATSAETGYGKTDVLNKIYSVLQAQKLIAEADEELEETEEEQTQE